MRRVVHIDRDIPGLVGMPIAAAGPWSVTIGACSVRCDHDRRVQRLAQVEVVGAGVLEHRKPEAVRIASSRQP